jgi:CHAD domain-containing protein
MVDNFFPGCPAKMERARQFTDYRTATRREQYNKNINGIVRDDDYRQFLQNNGEAILDKVWEHDKQVNSCFPNECLHTYPLRSTPSLDYQEMQLYTAVRTGKMSPAKFKCVPQHDYRSNYTKSQG